MTTALFVLLILANFYVFGPLLVMVTQRQSPPRTRPIPPEQAPESVARAIFRWRSEFGEAGLSLAAVQQIGSSLAGPEDAAASGAHVLHFVDRAAAVHGLDYLTPHGQWQVFLTRFADGQEVVTTNYRRPLTSVHPQIHVARMPGVRDVGRLHDLHGVHVAHAMGAAPPAPVPGDPDLMGFVADHERRTLERQREVGAMAQDGGVFRPPVRGAFASVWRYLPPLRWTHAARDRRLARALTDTLKRT